MGDSYRPPPRNGGYGAAGYIFRGAAAGDTYRPQQGRAEERFTFNAPTGPSAPRFHDQQPTPRAPRSHHPGANKNGGRGRGGRQQAGGYRRLPKPAHAREILQHKERETTPEQLAGMNTDGQLRYADNGSGSEDGEVEGSDDDSSSEDGEGEQSRKRFKTDDAELAPPRPQWSNPDPYTVLPPTDLGLQPKKDIVKTIRKAKTDVSAPKSDRNAVKENLDFISFDDFEDDQQDDQEMEGTVSPVDLWMPTDLELADIYAGTDVGNKKRKRMDDAPSQAGLIVTDWRQNNSNPTPWHNPDGHFMSSMGLKLHMEISDFHDYVRPRSRDADVREDIIDRIERAVRNSRDAAGLDVKIRSFGSFASGLYLPTADMDLVAMSRTYDEGGPGAYCRSRSAMNRLASDLVRFGIAKRDTMAIISRAKVPIIKIVDEMTGVKVDISFENDSGLRAIPTIRAWRQQYPEMVPLVLIIKQFLAMRGLNEVHTGGLGGFTIICLVVNMLQIMPENQRKSLDTDSRLGVLLLTFLDLYGNKFNLQETGIKMNPPGYFSKKDPNADQAKINATGLTIIDPNNAANDISGGSKKVGQVFMHFRGALYEIQTQMNKIRLGQASTSSILGCILGGNYSSFADQRRIFGHVNLPPRASQPSTYAPPPPPPPQPSTSALPPPPAPHPWQRQGPPSPRPYPWHQYSQQAPLPARGGHHYAAHDAHAFQQPAAALPPLPAQSQHYQQSAPSFTSLNGLSARPPPATGSGSGPEPGNNIQRPGKKSKKKAKAAQNELQNSTNGEPAKKSIKQKRKEKRARKQEKKQQQVREDTKKARGERAANRIKAKRIGDAS